MAAMIGLRPCKLPPAAAFFIPEGLSDLSLLHLLRTVAGELISVYSVGIRPRNERLLVRRIVILMELFEGASNSCCEAPRRLSRLAVLCLKEIYIVVHRTRFLLEYCAQASRLWLILRGSQIAVLPLDEFYLAADVQEHVELLQRQEFETGQPPNASNLKSTFVEQIGISKARDLEFEIAFLEEQIIISEEDAEYDLGIVADVVALARFCRFLLYGLRVKDENKKKKISPEVYSISAPKDFCCPVSLDLMRDPVVVSTGQTYDRDSISCWLDGGSRICPNSGQVLDSAALVPNLALRSLISQWCAANDLLYESEGAPDGIGETMSKAAVEAIRATARILIGHLSNFNEESKAIAAHELHMLAKIGKKSRGVVAEEGGIPLLCRLLSSPNSLAQENAMTALLNLTMLDENKRRIIEEQECLSLIVMLLRRGSTAETKENAVAALLSLSAVSEYKKKIVGEVGGLEMLAWFLRKGSPRGRKDAALALFNLATQPESWERMVESGAVGAMVCALGTRRWQRWWLGRLGCSHGSQWWRGW
ncbi:hypothetical protein HPP92_004023 [Vanilla planifolia]|uniref:RING-type E3 ubiquitin transferase n=1 Tax=Vanilla planifolia TaxID=51239 RepID=A0A835S899_VANPL|nr:hypothetical protein HPP92_004023 [Vanilla planifolia]